MARIRSIKPEFWLDRKLARQLTRDARMLYMGLWNVADEHARANGDPLYVKGQVFPYDDDLDGLAIDKLLDDLAAAAVVVRYEVDDDPYLLLPKLAKHQRLEPVKVASRLPEPPPFTPDCPPDPVGSARRADESAPGADELSLLYVAGSRLQVAGEESAILADTPRTDESRPDVDELCDHLADRIEANGSKRPTITRRWRDAARLLLDRDGHDPAQVRAVLDWSQTDDFWRANVLSMPKLRAKFDTLRLQSGRPDTRAGPNGHVAWRNPTDPDAYGGQL